MAEHLITTSRHAAGDKSPKGRTYNLDGWEFTCSCGVRSWNFPTEAGAREVGDLHASSANRYGPQ